MSDIIKVGMADLKCGKNPIKLTTLGLGSCVGIVLYDKINKVSGLAHVMLPNSSNFKNISNKSKFCDLALEVLITDMEKLGASRRSMVAKIAGGAKMFAFSGNNDLLSVGERNINAARENLKKYNIRIIAEDVGLDYGRTIVFDSETSDLSIRSMGKRVKII